MAPFLEILTRHLNGREELLERNIASLDGLTDDDWEQTFLIDNVGRGITWATENLARQAHCLRGDYIWILDDDDVCIRPALVRELREIVERNAPDVIMMRMDCAERGVLPDGAYWENPPAHAHISSSCYVVRRDVWQWHAGAWVPGVYHSDYLFIQSVFSGAPVVYWHNVIAARVQQIGLGRHNAG